MAELPARLASALGSQVELRLNSPIKSVTPRRNDVTVLCADTHAEALEFDAVVVATTARSASALLGDAFGPAALALQESSLLSSLTVSLAFRRDSIQHPLAGTGFIVSEPERLDGVRAVTFCSSKLPNRAPSTHALLRLFFRPSDDDLRELSDAAWAARAERALARALPLSAPAERAFVSRWPKALPIVDAAHLARVGALEAALVERRIWLAGAAFHGSGIDAAIRSAENAARLLSRD
jgi:oxygen-dependent protoporphyrinogen oxidase